MPVPTIEWKKGRIKIIDQTLLPARLKFLYLRDVRSLFKAIRKLQIRGAPAIGIAAAFGVVLAAQKSRAKKFSEFNREVSGAIRYLSSSRPTAINLFWALARMKRTLEANRERRVVDLKKALLGEAKKIMEEDKIICRRMAGYASRLIKSGDKILTHCNAGGLATADYGTAVGAFYRAKEEGKKIAVYVDETRPLLQGARLTAWELMRNKIEVVLICDSMAATLMQQGKVDKVLVGSDRITRNGDAANKIGTYNLAVLARAHKIPFYIVAPLSSFDFSIAKGSDIPIEERPGDEIRCILGRPVAPGKVKVYNPAFDVTPHRLITAIITEYGIVRPPYRKNLARFYRK